ncbi:MAG: hypothetical protein JNJ91_03020 [Flavobacteriales bacterium]|nr:hypothetical protein [Flavobacteriales bacterium]
MKPLLILLALALTLGPVRADGEPATMGCDQALTLLQRSVDRMYGRKALSRDSTKVIEMLINTTPREGASHCSKATVHMTADMISYTSDEVREYIDTKNHVRIWSDEKRITLRPGGAEVQERSMQLLTWYQDFIVEQAHVLNLHETVDAQGRKILRIVMNVSFPQYGGTVKQIIELDRDREEVLTWEILPPATQPLRSLKMEYAQRTIGKHNARDPFIKGLLAQRAPVQRYQQHTVVDQRTR